MYELRGCTKAHYNITWIFIRILIVIHMTHENYYMKFKNKNIALGMSTVHLRTLKGDMWNINDKH